MAVSKEILDLLGKLKEMTVAHGCTPAEAERAAAHIQRLLHAHQLSMADIESKSLDEEATAGEFRRSDGKQIAYGVIEFANEIGAASDCPYCPDRVNEMLAKNRQLRQALIAAEEKLRIACKTTVPGPTSDGWQMANGYEVKFFPSEQAEEMKGLDD